MPTMTCPRCWAHPSDVSCDLCRGTGVVPDTDLSPHFRLSECLVSDTAVRKGIPNDPGPDVLQHLHETATMLLDPVRALLGVPLHINSGYRSPAVNSAIGGSATSAHMTGYAADTHPLGMSLADMTTRIIASALRYDQIIYEMGTWVHLGWRGPNGSERREALMMFGGKYFRWDPNDARVGA